MPVRRCRVPVQASLEKVWSLLLARVERSHSCAEPPLRWAVIDQGKGWLLRDVVLPGGQQLRERITVDEANHTLSTVQEHPHYEGVIIDRVKIRKGAVELESAMDWRFRPGAEPGCEDPWNQVRHSVERTRALAEEQPNSRLGH